MSPEVVVTITYSDNASNSRLSTECVTLKGLRRPITSSKVRAALPFLGTFHFRVRAALKAGSADFVWMDITAEDEEIRPATASSSIVEIRALMLAGPVDAPCSSEHEFEEYSAEVAKTIKQRVAIVRQSTNGDVSDDSDEDDDLSQHKDESILQKLGVPRGLQKTATKAVDLGMKSVAVGATSIWNNLKTIGASIQSGINIIATAAPPSAMSDQTEEVLASLCDDISVAFKTASKEHVDLLRKLWKALFVDSEESFSLASPQWREAGFQKDGPAADLKSSGVLALKCLVHMAATHPTRTQEMLARNKANVKQNYPFAVVAVNVTVLLAELFYLRGNNYLSASTNYWGMFESVESFYEVFSAVFFQLDKLWVENGCTRPAFGELIGQLKRSVQRALAQGPTTVQEFRAFVEEA